MQLTGVAHHLAGAQRKLRGPARVEGLVTALGDHKLHTKDVAGQAGDVQRVRPVPEPRGVAGGGRRIMAGQDRGDVQRLVRDAVVQRIQHLIGGLDAQRRNGRRTQRVAGQEHQAGLEERRGRGSRGSGCAWLPRCRPGRTDVRR